MWLLATADILMLLPRLTVAGYLYAKWKLGKLK